MSTELLEAAMEAVEATAPVAVAPKGPSLWDLAYAVTSAESRIERVRAELKTAEETAITALADLKAELRARGITRPATLEMHGELALLFMPVGDDYTVETVRALRPYERRTIHHEADIALDI